MKYKLLLTGKYQVIIDDIFKVLGDEFDCVTTSMRAEDIVNHLRFFQPDVLVYCMNAEGSDNISKVIGALDTVEKNTIGVILVGDNESCDEFVRERKNLVDLVMYKPVRASNIRQEINTLMETSQELRAEAVARRRRQEEWERRMKDEQEREAQEAPAWEEDESNCVEQNDAPAAVQAETKVQDAPGVAQDGGATAETAAGVSEEKARERAKREQDILEQMAREREARERSIMEQALMQQAMVQHQESVTAGTVESQRIQDENSLKHILVIDDDPLMLRVIKEELKADYNVATAISGKIGLQFLQRKKTDLVLLDYEMPEENGAEVLEKIRANESTKNLPVVFLTGIKDKEKIKKVLSLKPQGYLLKPINHDMLVQTINQVLKK